MRIRVNSLYFAHVLENFESLQHILDLLSETPLALLLLDVFLLLKRGLGVLQLRLECTEIHHYHVVISGNVSNTQVRYLLGEVCLPSFVVSRLGVVNEFSLAHERLHFPKGGGQRLAFETELLEL